MCKKIEKLEKPKYNTEIALKMAYEKINELIEVVEKQSKDIKKLKEWRDR